MEVDMENPLDCIICNAILKEPVILPCGHTICKLHEIDRRVKSEQGTNSIHCRRCNLSHLIPVTGFPPNRAIETLLHRKFQNINLGEEHAKASKAFKKLENMLNRMRQIKEDPGMEIHHIIADLKNKIDLTREELKKKINNEAQQLIDELDELERTCLANNTVIDNIKSSDELNNLIAKFENECATMKKELSLYERNEERWKAISDDCSSKAKSLLTEYETMKEIVFDNRLFDFELKQTKYCHNGVNYLFNISCEVKLKDKDKARLGFVGSSKFYHYSNAVSRFGLLWELVTWIPSIETEHLVVYLNVNHTNKISCNYRLRLKISIHSKSDPLLKDLEYDFEKMCDSITNRINIPRFRFQDIKRNTNVYNREDESFVVDAYIYDIERIKI